MSDSHSEISCVPHFIRTHGIHKESSLHLVCGALMLTWLMLLQSAHYLFTYQACDLKWLENL